MVDAGLIAERRNGCVRERPLLLDENAKQRELPIKRTPITKNMVITVLKCESRRGNLPRKILVGMNLLWEVRCWISESTDVTRVVNMWIKMKWPSMKQTSKYHDSLHSSRGLLFNSTSLPLILRLWFYLRKITHAKASDTDNHFACNEYYNNNLQFGCVFVMKDLKKESTWGNKKVIVRILWKM